MAGGSSSGRELIREGASPGPTTWLVCVLLGLDSWRPRCSPFQRHLPEHPKLRQSCHWLNSQPIWGGWRNFRWECPPGRFTTEHGRTSMSAGTERRRKPPDSGTERACFILSKPPKTKRSSIMTAEGDRLAKNIRIQWQKNSVNSKKNSVTTNAISAGIA